MRQLRERALRRGSGGEPGFRWRGGEVSRIEGFSDAVFAFAVTLLVVSLEVPHTFDELLRVMRGFPAFGLCFALLILIWHEHYRFFRRYGLSDTYTITLNAALLFVVLFYIYPLKFLFTLLIDEVFGLNADASRSPIGNGQAVTLLTIYSLGFLAVFLVLFLLHLHAYRRRSQLELDELEIFDTRSSLQYNLIFIGVALLSVAMVRSPFPAGAGWVYFLLGPACTLHGRLRGGQRSRLRQGLRRQFE
ncbi:MAG TPA: TMEM175 family protein [Candidatus Polarisedimenticolia bacterium]|nr:TMEM175 family protein [Candidatus Polarisedimenticolia bacterium]